MLAVLAAFFCLLFFAAAKKSRCRPAQGRRVKHEGKTRMPAKAQTQTPSRECQQNDKRVAVPQDGEAIRSMSEPPLAVLQCSTHWQSGSIQKADSTTRAMHPHCDISKKKITKNRGTCRTILCRNRTNLLQSPKRSH
jgi:hypothetical protein